MKRFLGLLFLIFVLGSLMAAEVEQSRAFRMAQQQLQRLSAGDRILDDCIPLNADGILLAYIYPLEPQGYIVISGFDDLPPVIAYSLESGYPASETDNPLANLLRVDLPKRLQAIELLPEAQRTQIMKAWNQPASIQTRDFEQWPPQGTSPTGGWIKTEWTQSAPYNNLIPIDTSTGNHSVAGCPAVAMAQIVNYHECINGTVFTDADDYHHVYGGLTYWVDDDYAAWGFPSWFELNGYLSTLMQHYKYQNPLTDTDMAALVYACGAAAHQVYSAAGSGTFAVAQAYQAFQRFGFDESELLTDANPDLYPRIIDNIQHALPVHLAIVNQDWSAGHNVVIDGYNTDQFYHLNFGWGGPYSGWYLLPSQIPYSLNVIEGAIVDIMPRQYLLNVPETLVFNTVEECYPGLQMEFINLTQDNLLIEAIPEVLNLDPHFMVMCSTVVNLPYVLPAGQSLYVTVGIGLPVKGLRDMVPVELRLIHSYGASKFYVSVNSELSSDVDDEHNTPSVNQLSCYPNPFSTDTTIQIKGQSPANLEIFNLKGQKIRTLMIKEATENRIVWDGKDKQGNPLPRGLYIIRMGADAGIKLLKLQ